jgi:glycosyltransferase involved in cell wall biosynthesis
MAAGLPVIATRCGGVEEVVEDGVSGLLVSPGEPEELAEAIRTLDGNRKALSEMGERGRVLASHFSVDRMVREILSIYQTLA